MTMYIVVSLLVVALPFVVAVIANAVVAVAYMAMTADACPAVVPVNEAQNKGFDFDYDACPADTCPADAVAPLRKETTMENNTTKYITLEAAPFCNHGCDDYAIFEYKDGDSEATCVEARSCTHAIHGVDHVYYEVGDVRPVSSLLSGPHTVYDDEDDEEEEERIPEKNVVVRYTLDASHFHSHGCNDYAVFDYIVDEHIAVCVEAHSCTNSYHEVDHVYYEEGDLMSLDELLAHPHLVREDDDEDDEDWADHEHESRVEVEYRIACDIARDLGLDPENLKYFSLREDGENLTLVVRELMSPATFRAKMAARKEELIETNGDLADFQDVDIVKVLNPANYAEAITMIADLRKGGVVDEIVLFADASEDHIYQIITEEV